MPHRVNIESFAKVDGEKINVQTTVEHVADGRPPEQVVIEKVIDLNEQVTRDALIALGWTPPGGRCAAYNTIRERIQAIQYEGENDLVSWRFETPAPPFPKGMAPTHERIAVWLDTAVDSIIPAEPKCVEPDDPDLPVTRSLLVAACKELRRYAVPAGADDQVVLNLEAICGIPHPPANELSLKCVEPLTPEEIAVMESDSGTPCPNCGGKMSKGEDDAAGLCSACYWKN